MTPSPHTIRRNEAPICPQCSIQMVERQNRSTGVKFYGCKNYPECDETAEHEDAEDDEGGFYGLESPHWNG